MIKQSLVVFVVILDNLSLIESVLLLLTVWLWKWFVQKNDLYNSLIVAVFDPHDKPRIPDFVELFG